MPRKTSLPFQKNLLAIAIGAALTPAWALDLVQEPPMPTSKSAFVAPNVIISVDDSGSMNYRLDVGNDTGATDQTAPVNGVWPTSARRINVLKHSLNQVFTDTTLIPDGKIRLGWQAMWNNGGSPGVGPAKYACLYTNGTGCSWTPAGATSIESTTLGTNSIKPLDTTHRNNFIDFVKKISPKYGTPSPSKTSPSPKKEAS